MTQNELRENEIQETIFRHIDSFNSFRFNAGAGAGKTYALIESLKYILRCEIYKLQTNNQKIACVTYTNVAVNEIKNRLGNSDIVHVSTIHERLWVLIKTYQNELVECHKEKIEKEILRINDKISDVDDKKCGVYAKLSSEQKEEFIKFALDTKDTYYENKKSNSAGFKAAYASLNDEIKPDFLSALMRNHSNFKSVVSLIYERERYESCITRINNKSEKKVIYDSKSNNDRLHYMKFSHDTLLEYSLTLVKKYSILCRVVIDQYPYFFIDEYQDTNEKVIELVKCIYDYAKSENKHWLVGYFGDTAQNIYEGGVGNNILSMHGDIDDVNKEFNRRSHVQVIDIINKIRNDHIVQQPMFNSINDGSVGFWYSKTDEKLSVTGEFLKIYKQELEITNADKKDIHCLVLTNKIMSELNGFGDIYNVVSQSSDIYYRDIKTKLLSNELEKLHPTILLCYKFIMFYKMLKLDSTTYYDLFGRFSANIPFSKASAVVHELKNIEESNFEGFLSEISRVNNETSEKLVLTKCLINCLDLNVDELRSESSFESLFLNKINNLMNGSEDESDEKNQLFLKLKMSMWCSWADFINMKGGNEVNYHTYHGTKGEEFENVAIIMEHSFGGGHEGKDKFKQYFEHLQLDESDKIDKLLDNDYKCNFDNTRNLLYVACSRAIKNLKILYLDDISDIKEGIDSIFNNSYEWPIEKQLT